MIDGVVDESAAHQRSADDEYPTVNDCHTDATVFRFAITDDIGAEMAEAFGWDVAPTEADLDQQAQHDSQAHDDVRQQSSS